MARHDDRIRAQGYEGPEISAKPVFDTLEKGAPMSAVLFCRVERADVRRRAAFPAGDT